MRDKARTETYDFWIAQALEQYEREQKMARLEQLKAKAMQQKALQRAAELQEKQERHKLEVQEQFERELQAQTQRQKMLQIKEADREAARQLAREMRGREVKMVAERKREKIEATFAQQRKIMQSHRDAYNLKQAREAERKQDWERERDQKLERSRMRAQEKSEYIAGVQHKMAAIEEGRKQARWSCSAYST